MNAADRNTRDYAHRGQRIVKYFPAGMTAFVGQQLSMTFDGPGAWVMPATVREVVTAIDGQIVVTIEPGAAVKEPARWHIVDAVAAIRELTLAHVPRDTQCDMFAV